MENISLEENEIKLLMDALTSHESHAIQNCMMGDLMSTMVMALNADKEDPKTKELFESKIKEREKKMNRIEAENKILQERIILIKAKLIQYRVKIGIDSICNSEPIKTA